MGIIIKADGEHQPICNECGIALCWGISEREYLKRKEFWDDWICEECRKYCVGVNK